MALLVSPQEEQAGAEDESLWATYPTDETPAHEETAELDVGFESPKSGGAASMPSLGESPEADYGGDDTITSPTRTAHGALTSTPTAALEARTSSPRRSTAQDAEMTPRSPGPPPAEAQQPSAYTEIAAGTDGGAGDAASPYKGVIDDEPTAARSA